MIALSSTQAAVRRRGVLVAIAVSLAVALGTALARPSAALAGQYTVYGCRTPTGESAPLDAAGSGWSDSLQVYPAQWKDACPNAAFMWMDPSTAHGDGAYAAETFVAPHSTTIAGFSLIRAVRLIPSGGYYYQALEDDSGYWHMIDGCNTWGGCHSFGDYQNEASASNNLTHTAGSAASAVQLKIICGKSGGCPSEPGGVSASVWLFASLVTLNDFAAPQLTSPPSGPLVSGGILSGDEPVSISASDQGGGVYLAEVEVDGNVLQSQVLDNSTGTCQPPFTAVVPCPLAASGLLDFDTARLPDGTHSLQLVVLDAAGNATTWGPVSITTVNNPCLTDPPAGGMTLRVGFPVRVRRRVRYVSQLTLAPGRRPIVAGTLTTWTGAPAAGAPICVAVRDHYRGAPWQVVRSFSTSGAGTFSYRLGPGPSRTIYFIDRVPGGAVSDSVSVNVRVPVRVHVNATRLMNGQTMVWTGRLPGPIPNGLLASLQVWRGRGWRTFQEPRIRRDGKWIARYRFQFTTGVQAYTFRLVVPHQSDYPYSEGASRPIRVTVTG